MTELTGKSALIVVDVQKDFCPGGGLAVPEGDQVIPVVNGLVSRFMERGMPVYATRDWHPEGHCSFEEQGGPWPPHCVRDEPGSEYHDDLRLPDGVRHIKKGTHAEKDAYSGFDGTGLENLLRDEDVRNVYVCGLATDYCVKATVLDGLELGFNIYLVKDGTRGVNIQPGDSRKAIQEMEDKGATVIRSSEII